MVCVAKPEELDESRLSSCYVTGWGRRTESMSMEQLNVSLTISHLLESSHSTVLKEIAVPLWQHSVCSTALQSQFGPKYNLPETAICAGAEGRDACDVRFKKRLW